jgi:hypothetical protein
VACEVAWWVVAFGAFLGFHVIIEQGVSVVHGRNIASELAAHREVGNADE